MAESFIGEIRLFPYPAPSIPKNWAICNGTTLPTGQNGMLYAIIGNIYGGDGENFQLPDLQERVPMHPGSGPDLSTYSLGETGGSQVVYLTQSQLPAHTHGTKALHATATTSNPNNAYLGFDDSASVKVYAVADSENLTAMHTNSLTIAGGGGPHANRQPFVALNFFISLNGVYPERS
ncbi:MAG: tail fiber protein [Victivallales bacterium]|jgi:microcystin-dependent protein